LPYIPAKRLKGLLRAQAEFLCGYGAAAEQLRLLGKFVII